MGVLDAVYACATQTVEPRAAGVIVTAHVALSIFIEDTIAVFIDTVTTVR